MFPSVCIELSYDTEGEPLHGYGILTVDYDMHHTVLNYLSVMADLWQSYQCFSSAKAEVHVYFKGTHAIMIKSLTGKDWENLNRKCNI